MSCSPFSAVRALNQCAYDNYNVVPDNQQAIAARDTVLTSFYVDDFLTSCDSEIKAIELASNVNAVLSAGHFNLRQWNSNSGEVLMHLVDNDPSFAELVIEPSTAAVLGLRWDQQRMKFSSR